MDCFHFCLLWKCSYICSWKDFMYTCVSTSLGQIPRSGIARLYGNFTLNFLRRYQSLKDRQPSLSIVLCPIFYFTFICVYFRANLSISTQNSLRFQFRFHCIYTLIWRILASQQYEFSKYEHDLSLLTQPSFNFSQKHFVVSTQKSTNIPSCL